MLCIFIDILGSNYVGGRRPYILFISGEIDAVMIVIKHDESPCPFQEMPAYAHGLFAGFDVVDSFVT